MFIADIAPQTRYLITSVRKEGMSFEISKEVHLPVREAKGEMKSGNVN